MLEAQVYEDAGLPWSFVGKLESTSKKLVNIGKKERF